jgi:hypothetical protein
MCDLKYARKEGHRWNNDTVDSAGDVGIWSDIAVDAHGDVWLDDLRID